MTNPVRYPFRVGQSRIAECKQPNLFSHSPATEVWIEQGLPNALDHLPQGERAGVFLVRGHRQSVGHVTQLLDVREASVQGHLRRGLSRLRDHRRSIEPVVRSSRQGFREET